MKKTLTKRIIIACSIALVFMILVIFSVQSLLMQKTAANTALTRIDDVISRLVVNDAETQNIIDQLNSDFISKADSFAEMIALDPSIIEDMDRLNEIAVMLDVDELHVTDEKGVIQWGTVPEYFGFDFAASDQAKEFMPILNDPSLKIAQDAQPNGAEGKYFQYVSVARKDKTGIVQVGITPTRLQNQIEKTSIANVLADITVGNNGYVMAVNKADGTVAAHKNAELIGQNYADIGISEKLMKGGSGIVAKIDGESMICSTGETEDYVLIAAISRSEAFSGRTSLVVIFILATLIMLVVIVMLINAVVQKNIIKGLNELIDNMQVISSGDLNTEVNVRTCPEYETLSNGINAMLANIRRNIDETVKLNEEQQRLFAETTSISADIGVQSSEMQEVAARLSEGSSTQAATVQELSASFGSISEQIKSSAESAKNASKISEETTKSVDNGAAKLSEMQTAMSRIEESSTKIGNIVKTIDDIAFQTNILALNAAVEAARAGQHGKGFAVVADEVRNLANKSAEATKGTAKLIEETKQAVSEGAQIANETAEQLRSMMSGIAESNRLIENIAVAADEQAEAFSQISDSMMQISTVVQQNAEISASAEETARKLDEQARSLKALFE
ncbi:MAG: methyl-accepting chemotaxis protein [Oscillospiraceae bacterium]|nr:methyl-accepting chemotaxis protein [Oscillospiraceae bacterium]